MLNPKEAFFGMNLYIFDTVIAIMWISDVQWTNIFIV